MKKTRIVRICGILCIVFAALVLLKGMLAMVGGVEMFYFDPAQDSSGRKFQLMLNFFLGVFYWFMSSSPMYLGLAAFYFAGIMGKNKWVKALFITLIVTFLLEVIVSIVFGIRTIFIAFDIRIINEDPGRAIYWYWLINIGGSFLRITPFIAVIFSAAALAARRASTSVCLAPAFAAFAYVFFNYAWIKYSTPLPDYFAIIIYIGLTALFFDGAIGKTILARLLFGSLVMLFLVTKATDFIVNSVYFLNVFDVAFGISKNVAFQWFALLGGIKYIFLPVILIAFGIASIIFNKEKMWLGLLLMGVALLYIFSIILPQSINMFATKGSSILFKPVIFSGLRGTLWVLVAIAVIGITRWIKPFLIFVIILNSLSGFFLVFTYRNTNEVLATAMLAFVTSHIVNIIFTFYIWHAIDDGKTAIKPWLAVAGGLIPVLGTIWMFIILSQYAKSFDDFVDRNQLTTGYISPSPVTMYIVFSSLSILGFWIPYVGKLLALGAVLSLIFMIREGCNAVNKVSLETRFPPFVR